MKKDCRYIKWFLPVLFITYYANVSVFLHSHMENGMIAVHSHPFPKSCDGASHQHHSLAEILFFSGLSTISSPDGAVHVLQLHFFCRKPIMITENPVSLPYINLSPRAYSLRAPPLMG